MSRGGQCELRTSSVQIVAKMSNSTFVTEAFTLLGVGLSVIGTRTILRYKQVGVRKLQADDYLMLMAAVSPLTLRSCDCRLNNE